MKNSNKQIAALRAAICLFEFKNYGDSQNKKVKVDYLDMLIPHLGQV
jgi:hypothetical protein